MRRGPWHQFGDRSQRLVLEQLEQGVGVGVVISPRDLTLPNAVDYSRQYHDLGAHVLVDQQFYNPDFSNEKITSYFLEEFRTSVSSLHQISDADMSNLARRLEIIHRELQADGVIAPAVVYEAGRSDIVDLNARLFDVAKNVGDAMGIPTYATLVLGNSVLVSEETTRSVLSQATSQDADGWYYACEFGRERLPSTHELVLRCCTAGLTLACTGKPLLHAYAGPMALLSLGFGATGAAIGHSQNLWHFTRGRWEGQQATQGGGGNAPPRFFSSTLWGTIVYPDETSRLPSGILSRVLSSSPFSEPVNSGLQWGRWDANKHLVFTIGSVVGDIAYESSPRHALSRAIAVLEGAVDLHREISRARVVLADGTNAYQRTWLDVARSLLSNSAADFDYLELLG